MKKHKIKTNIKISTRTNKQINCAPLSKDSPDLSEMGRLQ